MSLAVLGGKGSGNFGHAGRKGEVGGSSDASGEAEKQQTLAAAQTDDLAHPLFVMGLPHHGGAAQQYVTAYGERFQSAPLPDDVMREPPGQCYRNASLLALQRPDLTYAEGFGKTPATGDLTFMHAWCVTKDGQVIDPTWDHPEQCQYFGIKYDRMKYLKSLYTAKVYGVLGSTPKVANTAIATGGKRLR